MTKTDKLLEYLRKRAGKATTIEAMASASGFAIAPTRSALCALKKTGRITYETGDYTTIQVLDATPATRASSPPPKRSARATKKKPRGPARGRIPASPPAEEPPPPPPIVVDQVLDATPATRALLISDDDLDLLRRALFILNSLFDRANVSPTLGQHFKTVVLSAWDTNAAPTSPAPSNDEPPPDPSPPRRPRTKTTSTRAPRVASPREVPHAARAARPSRPAASSETTRLSKEKLPEDPPGEPQASPAGNGVEGRDSAPAPTAAKKPNGVRTRWFGPENARTPLPTPGRPPAPIPTPLYGEQVDPADVDEDLEEEEDEDDEKPRSKRKAPAKEGTKLDPADGDRFAVVGFAGDELSTHPDLVVATQAMQRNRDANFVRRILDGKAMTQPKRPAA